MVGRSASNLADCLAAPWDVSMVARLGTHWGDMMVDQMVWSMVERKEHPLVKQLVVKMVLSLVVQWVVVMALMLVELLGYRMVAHLAYLRDSW